MITSKWENPFTVVTYSILDVWNNFQRKVFVLFGFFPQGVLAALWEEEKCLASRDNLPMGRLIVAMGRKKLAGVGAPSAHKVE